MVQPKLMIEIETPRLRLRQWKPEDYDAIANYYSDEANAQYVGGKKDAEHAWRHFALIIGHWVLKGFGYWALEEKTSGQFVGSVGLWQSPTWPELELGYWLVPAYQGKGYASEACRNAIEFAKHRLKAPSLVSYIDPANGPSIRLAERLGARYDGSLELASFGTHSVYRYF